MAAILGKKVAVAKKIITTITKKKNTYIIIICHCFHDLIIVLKLFFYDACIDIWQQLHVCAICLKLVCCNDSWVMVWLGEFCSSIQNYLYNWHWFFFFMKTSKPNNHSKYFAVLSHFVFTTSWFRFSESQILHKPIYNKWTSKWNNKIQERWSKIKDDTIFII